ncbi:hypothetical protein GPL15_00390 [Clostridium sp. MCC353]|uniref:anti-sigma-I factor RsgI family protein n=1 Tax=Clostridium sp. MCC353 TaxID=2592646 RepID=UPI001C02C0C6|nr:hypothetical protein [Clostridium sp. MCC353]MBT9774966.1 hypothetical protein [Clostridium sp. MCC353]
MKCMVMECHLSYAVVLDENGRFLKVANLNYEVGQTVTDVIEMNVPEQQAGQVKKRSHKWMRSLAAAAACLTIAAGSMFHMDHMTHASLFMSINPEVRIDVNRKDVVVGLEGVNDDGKELIAGYTYRKKDLDMVMDQLVDRSIDMGYLHEGGQITLTLDSKDDQWVVSRSDSLTSHLNGHLAEKLTVTVEITDTHSENRKVTIPVSPSENIYEESDYGDTDSSGSKAAGGTGYDGGSFGDSGGSGDSGYDGSGSGDSGYDSGGSGDSGYDSGGSGDSGYDSGGSGGNGYDSGGSGDSGYENEDFDDGETDYGTQDIPYGEPDNNENGLSDYQPPAADPDIGDSGYNSQPDNSVQPGYHPGSAGICDDAWSDYEEPDDQDSGYDGQSDYD